MLLIREANAFAMPHTGRGLRYCRAGYRYHSSAESKSVTPGQVCVERSQVQSGVHAMATATSRHEDSTNMPFRLNVSSYDREPPTYSVYLIGVSIS